MDDDEKSTSHIFSGKIRYLWGALFTLLALLACSISIKSTIKLTKIINTLLYFYCLFETTTLSQSLRAKTTAKQSQRLVVTKAVISPPNGPLKKAGAKSEEDKLLADADSSSKGMFTNVDPAIRTIIPEANGRTVVKMVYVVLESQYQSSLSAAVKQINATNKNVCVQVSGYLLEELRNEDNLNQFKTDVENANVFIGSLIFIEELAEKIVDIVAPLRDSLDACVIFPSMPAVMRLNKLGTFSMAQLGQSKSAIASFMKKKKESGGFEEGMLKLVRTLPKVLKYLPSDKAAGCEQLHELPPVLARRFLR